MLTLDVHSCIYEMFVRLKYLNGRFSTIDVKTFHFYVIERSWHYSRRVIDYYNVDATSIIIVQFKRTTVNGSIPCHSTINVDYFLLANNNHYCLKTIFLFCTPCIPRHRMLRCKCEVSKVHTRTHVYACHRDVASHVVVFIHVK